jgi:hypothetical protein
MEEEALRLWRRCAKAGDLEGQFKLGFALYEGTAGTSRVPLKSAYPRIPVHIPIYGIHGRSISMLYDDIFKPFVCVCVSRRDEAACCIPT